MGPCVSRFGTMSAAAAESVHALTAKVVGLDGSMAQFAAPVTAHQALAATDGGTASPPHFLCCPDELDFDAPIRALGARDALQPGQLYFALPVSMLGRPLSAHDMAALAVKACAALGAAAVAVVHTVDVGRVVAAAVPSRDKSGSDAASNKQHRRQTTGRVAPFAVVSAQHADGEWKSHHVHGGYDDVRKAVHGDRTVGKTRRQGVGAAPCLASVKRLNVIVEAAGDESRYIAREMGSCVSLSGATPEAAESVSVHALTAKVVGLDGSTAQFAMPVTAHEALDATAGGASSPPCFLCCSDELDFDAPIRSLGAGDALQPGQLYFALPVCMLGRPLSAQDMAALAVKACAALGTAAPVVGTVDIGAGGVPSLDKSKVGAASNKKLRRQTTGRVAPVAVVGARGGGEWYHAHGGHHDDARRAPSGDRTVGKTRNGGGYKGVSVAPRRPATVQRLSVIVEYLVATDC
ncbi:hypothetical protein BAE44_0006888 [Dichanthelium oligosanthes]|uniref:Uncharacterized protein n=1 Tax=Dichanthelium oligosanthes TaxID=888268 RepID=A0A1E5W3Y7_9POAL|nr:hypothetical protein BAE44_0006888 [Dichanthelium oligosanthes]